MKKKFFYSMLAAATMLVSCNSEDEVVNNNPFSENGDGYVAFSIQLPQANATTRSNDEFDDGNPRPEEYQVRNAKLFLFVGPNETNAQFEAVYDLNVKAFNTDGNATDQCTSEGTVSQKISNPSLGASDNLYAYVIINDNGLITSTELDGTDFTSMTFPAFSKIIMSNIGNTTNGMLMTNSPVNDAVGGTSAPVTSNITTLAKLDPAKIYNSESQAEANPAGEIFVERAAVKVTVKKGSSMTGTLTSAPTVAYNANTITWELLNENQKYYNARQMKAAWLPLAAIADGSAKAEGSSTIYNTANLYRFASAAPIHTIAGTKIVRTYWGEDVNYNQTPSASTYVFKTNPTTFAKEVNTTGVSVYTFENTFDVDHQSSTNTTMIGFTVTFNGGENFYTANTLGESNILLIPTSIKTGTKVQDYISEYLQNNNSDFLAWYTANPGENGIAVTMTDDATNGTSTVATLTKTSTSAPALPASITTALVNGAIKFKFYNSGKAYYNVRIKHFGAELANKAETPWVAANHKANSIDGVYKTIKDGALTSDETNQNYLGRYGVLRNNWYIIDVDGIKKIGQPLPGDPSVPGDPFFPDTPDDEVENYIAVKIHVTPWALRKQSVIL